MSLPVSLSYTETGVTGVTPDMTPVSPREIAETVYKGGSVDTTWGRMSLISAVDKRIEDKAYRILSLISACAWKTPAPLSFDEIALAVNCSSRSAMRHVATLEKLGYLKVRRCRNRRNEYSLPYREMASATGKPMCAKCGEIKRLNKAAFCRACTKAINAEHGMVSVPRRLMERRSA